MASSPKKRSLGMYFGLPRGYKELNGGTPMKNGIYRLEIDKQPSLAYLEIVLENVEVIEMEAGCIEDIDVRGWKNLGHSTNDRKDDIYHCDFLRLCISKAADRPYPTYGGLSQDSVFERLLKFHDIVYINYLDSQKQITKTIYVPWDESSDTDNGYQSTKINEDGNLEILIQRKKA